MIWCLNRLFPLVIYDDVIKALSAVLIGYRCSSSDLPSLSRAKQVVNFMISITKCRQLALEKLPIVNL